MPNRIEKFATITYIPGSPAVPAQPRYCIPITHTVYTMGVNRTGGTGSASGVARAASSLDTEYHTWVLGPSYGPYYSGLQAEAD